MARKKKNPFKLNPEWMLTEPIDFEYNKYTLLDYIQKCEKSFEGFKIYPDFVELSLHLANVQSIFKEKLILTTDKKFEFCDDEILLKELTPKRLPSLSEDDFDELEKTLMYSGNKLMDAFSIGKSIWSIVYESTAVKLKKNKRGLDKGYGYIYFGIKDLKQFFIWEYSIKKMRGKTQESKIYLNKIYEGNPEGEVLSEIIQRNTSWIGDPQQNKLPIFEVYSNQNFPFEETLVPMVKRKVLSYILQTLPQEKIESFDSLKFSS
jgi:hypothetical protein